MRVILFLLVMALAGPAWGTGKQRTDINMVVAFDRSESIDTEERRAQIASLSEALLDQRFIDSVSSGYHGKLGISVMAWSSFSQVEMILPPEHHGQRHGPWEVHPDADREHGRLPCALPRLQQRVEQYDQHCDACPKGGTGNVRSESAFRFTMDGRYGQGGLHHGL